MPFLEDLSSSAADSIVSAVSSNPVLAGTAVAGVAAVGTVLLVKTIYDNINVVSALDQTDLSRYTDLKNAWKINFPGKRYPKDWTLNDNKPTIQINLQESGKILHEEAERLRQYCTYEQETRATILSHIGELFISISKRSVIADITIRRK